MHAQRTQRHLLAALLGAALLAGQGCSGGSGSSPPTCSPRYHVSTDGSDSSDGSAALPFATIDHAVAAVPAHCTTEILVAAGTYTVTDHIQIDSGVSLRGGYSAASWDERAYLTREDRANPTYRTLVTVEGMGALLVVGGDRSTVIEGLTLTGRPVATTEDTAYTALSVFSSSRVVAHNTFRSAAADSVAAAYGVVVALYDADVLFSDNIIEVGTLVPALDVSTRTTGLQIVRGASVIEGNVIDGGAVDSRLRASGSGTDGVRAMLASDSHSTIRRNVIRIGSVQARPDGHAAVHGIELDETDASTLTDNLFVGGRVTGTSGHAETVCIDSLGPTTVRFNTLVLGTFDSGHLSGENFGLFVVGDASIDNNIVDGSSLPQDRCVYDAGPAATLRNNDLHCHVLYQYSPSSGPVVVATSAEALDGLTDLLDVAGNVGMDPLFVDAAGGDFHLQVAPANLNVRGGARDVGVTEDLDGQPRTSSTPTAMTNAGASGRSMGAYEAD